MLSVFFLNTHFDNKGITKVYEISYIFEQVVYNKFSKYNLVDLSKFTCINLNVSIRITKTKTMIFKQARVL